MQTTFIGLNKGMAPKVYATLPILNESAHILTLLDDIKEQLYSNWILIVCVNQPDEWWDMPEKVRLCEDNAQTLHLLHQQADEPVRSRGGMHGHAARGE